MTTPWPHRSGAFLNRPAVAASSLAALAAVVGLAYMFVLPPASPLLSSDSPDYLYFDVGRPIGYPIFLRAIRLLTGGYDAVRPSQILLFVASTFVASWTVFRHGWGFIAAFAFALGVLGHPGPIGLADVISSDSLAASLYLLYLAAVLDFVHRPTVGRYGLVCLVTASLIAVRPVGVALIASSLVLLALHRRGLRGNALPASGLLLVLALIGWCATPVAHFLVHGDKTSTPLARGLVQKVIFEEPEPGGSPSCDDAYIESFALPVVHYMQAVPPQHRDLFRLHYSGHLRFEAIIPGLVQKHHLAREADADPILMCYSLARFRQRPSLFFQITAHDYWGLVTNVTFITARQRADYDAFLAAHPPVLPPPVRKPDAHYQNRERAVRDVAQTPAVASAFMAEKVSFEPPKARPIALIAALRFIQIAAMLAGFVCIALVCLRLMGRNIGDDWTTLGVIAIAAQLSLLVTAAVEIAVPRYLFPIWPYLWITIVFVTRFAYGWARRGRPSVAVT